MHLNNKGFMSFIFLVLGVIIVVGIAIFSLNMQSRETFFLVHYYYLDSAREQLAKSIQDESHDWIKNEMQSSESTARNILLEKIHNFEDFTVDLNDSSFSSSLQNSKTIAKFVGFDIEAKIHFKYLKPFFGKPKSVRYDSDGLIIPNPQECRGIYTIEVAISKDGVSSKTYEAWYNFRFINVLPPVVSRFSFFLKNQTESNGFVGNLNRLPFSNNKDKNHYKKGNCGIIETERSTVRPLVIINSLRDFQTEGQKAKKTIRSFDPKDTLNNIDYKGWVFLGTNEPKGVILNLANYFAFNFDDGGFRSAKVRNIQDSGNGKFYYGDYFHRQRGQKFKFSTRGELINANIADMPKPDDDYEWDEDINFLMISEYKNYQSFYKSIIHSKTIDGVHSNPRRRRMFASYYLPEKPEVLTEMGFSENADYRSQHPALLKPFGSYFYTNTPSRFYDNRSPTLIFGPVRYSFMTVSSLGQESDLYRVPPYQHLKKDNPPTPLRLPLPYANVNPENDYYPDKNNNYRYERPLAEWKTVDITVDSSLIVRDSKRDSPYFLKDDWALFAGGSDMEGLNHYLLEDEQHTYFYWERMGSAVWLDNYLHAYNAMINNGGTNEGGHAINVLKLNEIKSLDSTIEVEDNDKFFFPDDLSNSQMFNANRLILNEFSSKKTTHKRELFKGKLGSLSLFSDSFKFNPSTGEMNSESYDLRFKATHLTDLEGFSQIMIKESLEGKCTLELEGITYIYSGDDKDADDPEELRLTNQKCKNKKLYVKGKGIVIYDHDIVIPNDLLILGADELNSNRNQKLDSKNPFELIEIAPVTILSVNGKIKLGSSARNIYAYLVALNELNGTIAWETSPPDQDVSVIGGLAIHHLDLDDIDLIENYWLNDTFAADLITAPKQNIFYKNKAATSNGRLRIIFNNNFLPNIKENSDLHFTFVTSKGVHVVQ